MKPRLLEMTAFGPFAGTITVDFDDLSGAGLFLVQGPTGSGKTSLLDGICYALYGTVPGARHPSEVRSHHAPGSVTTEVVLEFIAGGSDWRVTRAPEQERAKKRGSGTTRIAPKATLMRRDSRGGRDEWVAVAANVTEVGDEILRIIGLNAAQFQQVVLLPQGRYEEALRADTKQREALLSTLFGTQRFSDVSKEIAGWARDANTAVAGTRSNMVDLARQARERFDELRCFGGDGADRAIAPATDVEGLDRRIDTGIIDTGIIDTGIIDTGIIDTGGDTGAEPRTGLHAGPEPVAELDVDALRTLESRAHEVASERAWAEHRARDADKRAHSNLEASRTLAERHRRRAEAEQRHVHLQRRAPDVNADRGRLDAADRAVRVHPLLRELERAERDAEACATTTRRASADASHAHRAVGAATEAGGLSAPRVVASWMPDASADASAVLEATRVWERTVAEGVRVAGEIAADEEAVGKHHADADAVRADVSRAAEERAVVDHEVEQVESTLREAREGQGLLAELQQEATRTASRADAARSLGALADAGTAAAVAAQSAQEQQARVTRARIAAVAGDLAAHLVKGDACPVCGSVDHPRPAPHHDRSVTDADVERAASDLAAAVERLTSARNELERSQANAGDAADDPDAAEEAARKARDAWDATRAAAARIPTLEASLTQGEQRVANIDARIQQAQERASNSDSLARELLDRIGGRRRAIAAQVGERVDPAALHDVVGAFLQTLDALVAAQRGSAAANARAADLRDTTHDALIDAAFESLDEARHAVLAEDARDELRGRVTAFESALAEVVAVLNDPDLTNLAPLPDVDALEQHARRTRSAYEDALAAATRASDAAEKMRDLVRRVVHLDTDLGPARARAERLEALAQTCAGTGSGSETRMSLERYVLAAHLERIADAASDHLGAMSDGRYTLAHSDERTRGGGASGLSLVVHDAHTGRDRDVSTLSGGEMFQASLALALGVADVVVEENGGAALEALFVDEGFGSLDADALDDAMAELDRLRHGGRLVGVVSHVVALRERIPAGITVTPGPTGSHVAATTTSR